jgi:hypothetical protein
MGAGSLVGSGGDAEARSQLETLTWRSNVQHLSQNFLSLLCIRVDLFELFQLYSAQVPDSMPWDITLHFAIYTEQLQQAHVCACRET